MRRAVGFLLVVLGVASLLLGVLAPTVLYSRLATVPLDQQSKSVSVGDDMSALKLSKAGVEVLRHVRLQSTRLVRGIPGKVKDKPGQTFWQTGVTSQTADGYVLSRSQEGVSFDRRSGAATNCCGDFVSAGTLDEPAKTEPVTHEGLVFKFPFDVQQRDYRFWDGDLKRAEPIKFIRAEKIDGTTVYRFQQVLGPETIGTQEGLPGSLFNSPTPVTADLVYQNTRTVWVEPSTGVIIKGVEQQNKRFEAPGLEAVPVTVGTIGYTDATVKDNAEHWGSKGAMLKSLKLLVPAVAGVLGLVLLALGMALLSGGRRAPRADDDQGAQETREPVTV